MFDSKAKASYQLALLPIIVPDVHDLAAEHPPFLEREEGWIASGQHTAFSLSVAFTKGPAGEEEKASGGGGGNIPPCAAA